MVGVCPVDEWDLKGGEGGDLVGLRLVCRDPSRGGDLTTHLGPFGVL